MTEKIKLFTILFSTTRGISVSLHQRNKIGVSFPERDPLFYPLIIHNSLYFLVAIESNMYLRIFKQDIF